MNNAHNFVYKRYFVWNSKDEIPNSPDKLVTSTFPCILENNTRIIIFFSYIFILDIPLSASNTLSKKVPEHKFGGVPSGGAKNTTYCG